MSRLLFRGTKTFWKTKSSLELAIVEYSKDNIYEIIAFDQVLLKHAPRLYIDAFGVHAILSRNIVGAKKEHIFIDGAVTTFLFNHISIIEYLPTSKSIKIDVRAIFYDEICAHHSPLVVERPPGLPNFASPFATNTRDKNGEDSFMFVFGRVRQLQIPLRDKWRLPLILVRVSKNLPLRESDEKIWACFVHNKSQEELLVTIASALARQVPSTCSRFPSIRSGGSLSGTATPNTMAAGSLSASGQSTPNKSRCSSFNTHGVDYFGSTTAATVTAVTTSADSAASPQPLPRCSSKLGLPPLKPSPHCQSRHSQSASSLPSTSSPVPQATAAAGSSKGASHHRVGSLDNLWSALGGKSTLDPLVSRSAPSSPQQRTAEITLGAAQLSEDPERILSKTYGSGTAGNTNRRLTVLKSSTGLRLPSMNYNSTNTPTATTTATTTITDPVTAAAMEDRAIAHPHHPYQKISSLSEWAAGLLRRRAPSPHSLPGQNSPLPGTTQLNRKG